MVFKSGDKLEQPLIKVITDVDVNVWKGVVCEFSCGKCNEVYIGKMGRNVKERVKEHKCREEEEHEQLNHRSIMLSGTQLK